MRKLLSLSLACLMATSLLAGCGSGSSSSAPAKSSSQASSSAVSSEAAAPATPTDKPLKVACLLNGNLGDKSFFDSANNGMKLVQEQLGCETKVVEMGFDNTKWEPTLYDISDQDYDLIVVGTYQMQEVLQKVAPDYPDKKYIIFDSNVDYTAGNVNNVYSITFKQNEGAYLAGAVAAMTAAEKSEKPMIGAVTALDIPVLNDFLVGYIQGAKEAVPEIKVVISTIGNFDDTAKAKELALAQYNMGATVSLNVAAQAGLGIFEAAKDKSMYAIGVDADQAMAIKESDPEKANLILTSVLKRVDNSILRSIKMSIEGTLPYGKEESLGMKEEAIGIADNEIYQSVVSEATRKKVDELSAKILSGEIKVSSAFAMTPEEITALKDSVKP